MAPNKSSAREAREARERLRRYNARQAVHENQHKRRRRDNILAIIGVVAVAAVAGALQIFYFSGGPGTPTPTPSASPSASATATPEGQNVGDVPAPDFAEQRPYTGSIVFNGDISLGVELDPTVAPQAVSSLLKDANDGYYIDKACHRLVTSESAGLIQCGALDANGTSDLTYSFGPIENAPADGLYPAGTIAIARVGDDAYSNGHQFFIVVQDTVLPADSAGGYSVVGTVTSGLDALIASVTSQGTADGAPDGAPAVPTTITGFTLE
ncbi:peptidyl-prolyl cis-trans isomerase B (cyclophilin B) [Microbacteriaceae bacterium SG_E_30_P1]|uniref:Peptidyl-prolyl cis-trans isomerase B (Cyclophilin B) n=1 Tax=Antiquaquibacter oligotrophicus TaxID=2880260 RepID=A0ABT6KNH5_9MICO|nr:peptidylprolyl isomerase [Antiquaquibacter oligotrophicus]MDH6180998.1 peptidyl-prolyl cis-trans isomerase B (cyclophilin B) [Antiquaquibacter oligotrophicus]UDF13302.1 peptidylprolyl isomerase [Antiquaquibacter oligotrophicus]